MRALYSGKLREVMPEEPREAVEWMMVKVVKAVGEAKLLGVRLQSAKHQESMCSLCTNIGHACTLCGAESEVAS